MNTTRLSHYVWNRHPPALPLQNAFGCSCQGTTHGDELSRCPDAAIKEVNIAASVASAFYSCAGAVSFSS